MSCDRAPQESPTPAETPPNLPRTPSKLPPNSSPDTPQYVQTPTTPPNCPLRPVPVASLHPATGDGHPQALPNSPWYLPSTPKQTPTTPPTSSHSTTCDSCPWYPQTPPGHPTGSQACPGGLHPRETHPGVPSPHGAVVPHAWGSPPQGVPSPSHGAAERPLGFPGCPLGVRGLRLPRGSEGDGKPGVSLTVPGGTTGALWVTHDHVSAVSRDGEVPPLYPVESCQILPVGGEGQLVGGVKDHPKDTGSCCRDLVTIPPVPPQPPQPQQNPGGKVVIYCTPWCPIVTCVPHVSPPQCPQHVLTPLIVCSALWAAVRDGGMGGTSCGAQWGQKWRGLRDVAQEHAMGHGGTETWRAQGTGAPLDPPITPNLRGDSRDDPLHPQ